MLAAAELYASNCCLILRRLSPAQDSSVNDEVARMLTNAADPAASVINQINQRSKNRTPTQATSRSKTPPNKSVPPSRPVRPGTAPPPTPSSPENSAGSTPSSAIERRPSSE